MLEVPAQNEQPTTGQLACAVNSRRVHAGASCARVPVTGEIPAGLPALEAPALQLRDVEGIVPLAAGCLLPCPYRERLGRARRCGKARLRTRPAPRASRPWRGGAGQGYPVAGGLSQSAVNDKAGVGRPGFSCSRLASRAVESSGLNS